VVDETAPATGPGPLLGTTGEHRVRGHFDALAAAMGKGGDGDE